MADEIGTPEQMGFTEKDLARSRIIEEIDANRRIAAENGRNDHLAELNQLEAMALKALERQYKENK